MLSAITFFQSNKNKCERDRSKERKRESRDVIANKYQQNHNSEMQDIIVNDC